MYSNNETLPKVGEGATILLWTDRQAYDVIAVSDDMKTVEISRCKTIRTDGLDMSESQQYNYEPSGGPTRTIVWRWHNKKDQKGAWYEKHEGFAFTKEIVQKADDAGIYFTSEVLTDEQKAEVYDKWGVLCKEVPGITYRRFTYSKINIVFGVRNEYYDFSF